MKMRRTEGGPCACNSGAIDRRSAAAHSVQFGAVRGAILFLVALSAHLAGCAGEKVPTSRCWRPDLLRARVAGVVIDVPLAARPIIGGAPGLPQGALRTTAPGSSALSFCQDADHVPLDVQSLSVMGDGAGAPKPIAERVKWITLRPAEGNNWRLSQSPSASGADAWTYAPQRQALGSEVVLYLADAQSKRLAVPCSVSRRASIGNEPRHATMSCLIDLRFGSLEAAAVTDLPKESPEDLAATTNWLRQQIQSWIVSSTINQG